MIGRIFIALTLLFNGCAVYAQQQLSQLKSERLYAKGKELIDHKHYGSARDVFTEFLSATPVNDPRKGEARYYVAFSALNLGHADGEKLIDQFVSEYPSSPKASTAYYDLAIFFHDEGNYSKAMTYFEKVDFPALLQDQQNKGHFSWGYSAFSMKKLDKALEQFNFVKTQNNAYSQAANYYAGFIEYSTGDFESALKDLRQAEKSSSYALVVPYIIANVYYQQKKYDELLQYVKSVKDRPGVYNAKEIAMLEAEAQYFKGDYQKAVAAYETYLQDENNKPASSVLFRAGYAYYALKQDEKALTYLKKAAAATDSVSYHASYYLGILYLKKGEKVLALNAFDHARRNNYDDKLTEESTFQYAKVSYDAGKPDQAIAELEKFHKTYPASGHDIEVKELLAQAYINGNNYNKAIQYIESLPRRNLTMDKAYQKACYLKGSELFNKEDYAGAVANFEKSLQYPIDPKVTAAASFWCGEAYSIGQKFNESSKHYLTVIGLGDAADQDLFIKARYGLGYAYYNTQVYDRALFNFKEFVNKTNKSVPNHTDGLIRLADCYYVTKSYQDALNNYAKAQNIGSSDNDYILLQSGVISRILDRSEDSRKQLSTLIKSYPKSTYRDDALLQLGELEIEKSNYPIAVTTLSQLIRESPTSPFIPQAYIKRALAYYNQKQYDKAAADYATVIRQYPTDPLAQDVILPLQEALNLAGKSDEFQGYLNNFKKANPDSKGLENVEYETAKNVYFNQQYQKAVTSFSTFINNYPQSSHVNEAKFFTAESYYRMNELDKALPLYEAVSTDLTLDQGNRIISRIAEINFKKGRYDKAVLAFKKLESVANSKRDLFASWSGLMESFYLLAKYDSVVPYANLIIERGNVDVGAQNKASLYLGKAAMAMGDYATAQDEFLNTLNTAQDEYGAEAKYLLAEIFYNQKQYKQCYETLIGLTRDFSAYDEWVGKAFLLLADNFLAQGDTFQAKATLESLIPHFPLQHVKDEAQRKLKAIETGQMKADEEAMKNEPELEVK